MTTTPADTLHFAANDSWKKESGAPPFALTNINRKTGVLDVRSLPDHTPRINLKMHIGILSESLTPKTLDILCIVIA